MREKINQLKEMYKVSGYNKQFIILFTIIIVSALIEIISIPYITKQILDIYIPSKNIVYLVIFCCIYIILLTISCYVTLRHCNIRSILKRKIQKDLREKVFNKMRRSTSKVL